MKTLSLKLSLLSLSLITPTLVLAAAPTNFKELISLIIGILNATIPVIVLFALVVFLWGVLKYMNAEGDDRAEARNIIIYGIIGLFVMISVWGLVGIIRNTFSLNNNQVIINNNYSQ